MHTSTRWWLPAVAVSLALSPMIASATPSPAQRRTAVVQAAQQGAAAIPQLSQALSDNDLLVRRAAARSLVQIGEPAKNALLKAMNNGDDGVRRIAVMSITRLDGKTAVKALARRLDDESEIVRQAVVRELSLMQPRDKQIQTLLEQAMKDSSAKVREIANNALWPFHSDNHAVRDRADLDYDMRVTTTIPLPAQGWKFKRDTDQQGHLEQWYAESFDDSQWADIAIEQHWQQADYDYQGVAWYRLTIDLPERPKGLGTDICFDAVDEVAWVWVNGQYIGNHDLGLGGWDQPFALEVTKHLKWGQPNQITVRVNNEKLGGGIWKPVRLEVLDR